MPRLQPKKDADHRRRRGPITIAFDEHCMSFSISLTRQWHQRDVELDDRASRLADYCVSVSLTAPRKDATAANAGAAPSGSEGVGSSSDGLEISHAGRRRDDERGRARGDAWHPVQAASIAHGRVPGGLLHARTNISAIGWIQEGTGRHDPARVREGMSGNLCRCGLMRGLRRRGGWMPSQRYPHRAGGALRIEDPSITQAHDHPESRAAAATAGRRTLLRAGTNLLTDEGRLSPVRTLSSTSRVGTGSTAIERLPMEEARSAAMGPPHADLAPVPMISRKTNQAVAEGAAVWLR